MCRLSPGCMQAVSLVYQRSTGCILSGHRLYTVCIPMNKESNVGSVLRQVRPWLVEARCFGRKGSKRVDLDLLEFGRSRQIRVKFGRDLSKRVDFGREPSRRVDQFSAGGPWDALIYHQPAAEGKNRTKF